MSAIKIKFWGTRGSVPGFDNKSIYYGGNTTCVSVTIDKKTSIILDAGSGIRICGEWLYHMNHSILLCLTHLHWDHIQGFPFFLPLHQNRNIYFYSALGKQGLQHCLEQMDGIKHPLSHDLLACKFICLNQKEVLDTLNLSIEHIQTHHPGKCYAYKLRIQDKCIVFIPDNQLHQSANKTFDKSKLTAFCRNADILIHDAQYTQADFPKKIDWGHSNYIDTVAFAIESNVKELYLFHHDPGRSDNDIHDFINDAKDMIYKASSNLKCSAAYDGLSVNL